MYDASRILPGLGLFVVVVTYPVWHAVAAGQDARVPKLVKPAEATTLSTLKFMEHFARVLPPGLVSCVSGGAETGQALIRSPNVRAVAFTGSVAAARAVGIPVIGIGGISSASDALEFMLAGCRAFQVGTANFVDPGVSETILADLQAWMERHRVEDIAAIVGTLEYPGQEAPACEPGVPR